MSNRGRRDGVAAGRWLREQRERRGITSQAELARRLGWDKAIVNNYETGRSSVPDERAEELAEFFSLDIIEVRRALGLWVPPEAAGPESPEEPEELTRDQLIAAARKLNAQSVELSARADEYLRRAQDETA